MRNYELTLILNPAISEEAVNDAVQKLISQIQEDGGILNKEEIQGKRRFHGLVGKAADGYLAVVSFVMQPERLPNIEKILKEDHILRHLLVSKPTRKVGEVPSIAQKSPSQPRISLAKDGKAGEAQEKVEIEDIDKKLEEIFKE